MARHPAMKAGAFMREKYGNTSSTTGCFYHGFACALADMNRGFDKPAIVVDVMRGAGITLRHLKEAGVDPYDLDEIRKCMKGAPKPRRLPPPAAERDKDTNNG